MEKTTITTPSELVATLCHESPSPARGLLVETTLRMSSSRDPSAAATGSRDPMGDPMGAKPKGDIFPTEFDKRYSRSRTSLGKLSHFCNVCWDARV
jgi:hypothetical protein